jgi:hypothetical protein
MKQKEAVEIIKESGMPGLTSAAITQAAKRPLRKSRKRKADVSDDPITPAEVHIHGSSELDRALREQNVRANYSDNERRIRGESKRLSMRDFLKQKGKQ